MPAAYFSDQERLACSGHIATELFESKLGASLLQQKNVLFLPLRFPDNADRKVIEPGATEILEGRSQLGGHLTLILARNPEKTPVDLRIDSCIYDTDRKQQVIKESKRDAQLIRIPPSLMGIAEEYPGGFYGFSPNAPFWIGETLHLVVKNEGQEDFAYWQLMAVMILDPMINRLEASRYNGAPGFYQDRTGKIRPKGEGPIER